MKIFFYTFTIIFIFTKSFAAPIKSPLDKLLKYFKDGEMIKIQSYNAKSYMEIKDGSFKKSPVTIEAFIAYPKKGEGPFPLVMFAHASGGPLLFTDKWFKFNRLAAKSLQKKGIAVMFIDNFAPRGTYTTYADQQKVPHWSTFIDTFMALDHAAKDQKINIKKLVSQVGQEEVQYLLWPQKKNFEMLL